MTDLLARLRGMAETDNERGFVERLEPVLADLEQVLVDVADYLEGCQDVLDGPEGAPVPNREMVLLRQLKEFLP